MKDSINNIQKNIDKRNQVLTLVLSYVHTVMNEEVLPNFTIIFRQEKEGSSPVGAETSLDNWLVKMGDQMQKALEKELLHVFKEASGK